MMTRTATEIANLSIDGDGNLDAYVTNAAAAT